MLNFLVKTFILLNTFNIHAQSINSHEESAETKKTHISYQELRDQLTINGDIFVTDLEGKLLFQENQSRMWKFGDKGDIINNLIFTSPNIDGIYLSHIWSITSDGKILVNIKQYNKMERKPHSHEITYGKLLKEEKKEVKNFEVVNWFVGSNKQQKVFLRLTPSLSIKPEITDFNAFPITLKNAVIFDNKGRVWAQGQNMLEGKYVAIRTHLGQIAMSYVPFKNAKEIGTIEGSQISLKLSPKLAIFIRSENPIVSTAKPIKIYGFVDYNKKTDSRNSVSASSSSTEKEFNLR